MEDEHDEQDDKVFIYGQGQANEDRVENNAEFQYRDTDKLGVCRVGTRV